MNLKSDVVNKTWWF